MYEFQRRDIVGLTKAVITDQYGFSEGCGNASECENAVYHEDYEFGCLECVDGEDVGAGAVRGRIVCTGFASEDFPLIRYDIGDVGVWASDEDRCECGRESSRILRIEGRSDDYIVTPEGRRIMRLDYVFKETGNVKECQVVQRRPDRIVVRIVRRMHFNANDEELITSRIGQWISPRLIVEYEYVNEIEREGNGKFRAVKSELCSGRLGTGGTRPVGDFVGRVGPN
jgi:phenylacetate-CoA ligase